MNDEPEIIKQLRLDEEKGLLKSDISITVDSPIEINQNDKKCEKINISFNDNNQVENNFEENISKKTDNFNKLLNLIADPIVIVDSKGKILETNNKIVEALGYNREDYIGKNIFKTDILSKKTKTILFKNLIKRMAGKKLLPYEIELKAKSGERIQFEINASKIEYQGRSADLIIFRNLTNRKELQEKIKENDLRLNAIFESLQAGVIIIDPEKHEILDINNFAAEMIGFSKDKIIGNICHNFICPAEKGKCPITDLNQNVDKSERKLIDKNKKLIDILKTVNIIKIDNRNALIESFVDISDLKESRSIVEKSKKQIEDILNAAADGIRIIGKDFKIIDMNKTMEKLIGMKKEESIGKTCSKLFGSGNNKCGTKNCSMIRVLKTGEGFQEEEKRIAIDGRTIDCLTCVTPYKDENGNIIGIIEDFRDITEVKKVKEELDEKEKRFKQFFESSPDYCYMVSSDGKILDINVSALNILGFTNKKEIIGKQIIPAVYSNETHAKELVKKWLKDGKLRNEEIKIKSKKEERIVLLSVDNVNDNTGNLIYSILMQKDITDINKAQEELKEKLEQLEKYKEVTVGRELKMIELKKKIKELEEKNSEEKVIA